MNGVSSARNEGLKVATGKYINFLDSDDYFSNDAFENVYNFFEKYYDETNVVALNLNNFEDSEGSWVNSSFFKTTQLIDMNKSPNFMQCQVGASFVKSEFAKKYAFDTKIKIHEDSHYLYRIFSHKPVCGVVSDSIYWHRIRENGSSATQTINHKENIFNITNYVFNDLIKFYKTSYAAIPTFLQTFILLEFNFYVIERIQLCDLTEEDFLKLKCDISYLLDAIDVENIKNHFVLSNAQKDILLILKSNINKLYAFYKNNNFAFYYTPTRLIKKIIVKSYSSIKSLMLFIPKKIFHKLRNCISHKL